MTKNNSHQSERQFCRQFEAEFVNDKTSQYKDIDARKTKWFKHEDGTYEKKVITYSIKWQSRAYDSQCFSFENALINTKTGERVAGNFVKCKADYCVISDDHDWYFYKSADLKAWVKEHAAELTRKTLTWSSIQENQNQERDYDDAENFVIPKADIEHFLVAKTKHMKRLPKNYKLAH